MHRNLDRRVETLVRVPSSAHVRELGELLSLAFDDGTASWHLGADGTWTRHHVDADGEPLVDMQEHFIQRARRRREAARH
jgi:polyphosphate kinase